jgi:NADH pyrophosphatase NudC (nudix superfamily)
VKKHDHCGYCGHRFAAEQAWPRLCAACGNTLYLNPMPIAVCLVPIGDGLLCVRRAIPPFAGQLALPGGYIDRAETWQQAAARELFEETGLHIDAGEVEHTSAHSVTPATACFSCSAAPARTNSRR